MQEVGPYLCEVMFVLSVEDHNIETLKVTGAHFKTDNYVVRTDGTTFGHHMSGAKPLDLADPAQLQLIEPLNAAVIAELNHVKTQLKAASESGQALEKTHNELVDTHNETLAQLQAMTARAADLERELGHVTRERDEAQEREQSLQAAAEAAEQDRQVLLDTLAQRSSRISALEADIQRLGSQAQGQGSV